MCHRLLILLSWAQSPKICLISARTECCWIATYSPLWLAGQLNHKIELHSVHSFILVYDWQHILSNGVWEKGESVVRLITLQQNTCVFFTTDTQWLKSLGRKSHLLGMLWRDFLHWAEGWIKDSQRSLPALRVYVQNINLIKLQCLSTIHGQKYAPDLQSSLIILREMWQNITQPVRK